MTAITTLLPAISIGAVAQRTGCGIETIRYYERIGLLPRPARSAGGHRIYGREQEQRLMFVRRCRELGFTLEEVRNLLRLVDRKSYSCAEVRRMTSAHLEEVRGKLEDLRRLERTLSRIIAKCAGRVAPDCPIIEALSRPAN
ncbi:MAG: MerR family transcriptional regulator [Dongiaceae bacterium]